ncbi:MAG: cysteine desulfurase family protein [Bacteroidota bacterium]
MQNVYLDNAATTQVRPSVITKMQEALAMNYGNPSSTHSYGRKAKTMVEQARKTIAKRLNAAPSEIIFTSGGTEADNMVLRCAVRDAGIKTLITSKIEHHAVLHTAEALAEEYNVTLRFVDLDGHGNPDLKHLEVLLTEDNSKKLVSLMHINNEIGNVLDIVTVAELVKKHDALFHSDTVQSIGHFPMDVAQIPVDFFAAAAHKFHGPKGVGFAFIRKNSGIKPLIVGGSQERGYRAGTEAFHNIVGLEEAFEAAYENLSAEQQHVLELKEYFITSLKKAIPEVEFNGWSGDAENSTYTLVNVRIPVDAQKGLMLLFHLDMKGIACSKGSACQSGSAMGSHVLNEILDETEMAKPSLRFSFSMFNTKEELDYTVGVLKEFVNS